MNELSVYMLQCADGSYYVGVTNNVEARLYQHNAGEADSYTWHRRPVTLVWSERTDAESAIAMEKRIKGWSRAKKEALIRGDWHEIARLAALRQAQGDSIGRPSTSSG